MSKLDYTKKLLKTRPKNILEKNIIKTLLEESEYDSDKLELLINEIFDYGIFSGAIPGLSTYNECTLFYKKHKREINHLIESNNTIIKKVLKLSIEEILKDLCENVLNLELQGEETQIKSVENCSDYPF